MKRIVSYFFFLLAALLVFSCGGQEKYPVDYVDLFIGTGKSIAITKWGNYGGIYPGAVSPWGMVQLTPETSTRPDERGYYFEDTSIRAFSCTDHSSGFPNGSSGRIHVLFNNNVEKEQSWGSPRSFDHSEEEAQAGYYSVRFAEQDRLEMTATQRTGMFRYYPSAAGFVIGLCNAGTKEIINSTTIHASHRNALLNFSHPWTDYVQRGDTLYLLFDGWSEYADLTVKLAVSATDFKGSILNMEAENPGWFFDQVKDAVYNKWKEELSVITVSGGTHEDKVKFYTALYHSMLMPMVASDADGRYTDRNGDIHSAKGNAYYARSSSWETFRTLNPLLTFLKPDVQHDVILSLIAMYEQSGRLPDESMTGYHLTAVVLDALAAGIKDYDTRKIYDALQDCLMGGSWNDPSIMLFNRDGYINNTLENSVNTTLEYAYNNWALAKLAERWNHTADWDTLTNRSLYYRNLFDTETGFFLPVDNNEFIRNPGEMGYQESDKWSSNFFVPHNTRDLINLLGGDEAFIKRLNTFYEEGRILHDNEPVLHYPYLYIFAGRPDLTANKVHEIMHETYFAEPGGIPGNDDWGSMSSWYVWSAMGIYPFCPGTGEYVLSTPLFDEVIINLPNGNVFTVRKEGVKNALPFASLQLNNTYYQKLYLDHAELSKGGILIFTTTDSGVDYSRHELPYSFTGSSPLFEVKSHAVALTEVESHQENLLYFELENRGATGAKLMEIHHENKIIASKLVMVESGEVVNDSIPFRLYKEGTNQISLEDITYNIYVKDNNLNEQGLICTHLSSESVIEAGGTLNVSLEIRNITGKMKMGEIEIWLGDNLLFIQGYQLNPGEKIARRRTAQADKAGVSELKCLDVTKQVKVYAEALQSSILSFDFANVRNGIVPDHSGFANHGKVSGDVKIERNGNTYAAKTGRSAYIELPDTESLMEESKTVTLSVWINPQVRNRGSSDILTKGNYTLLKLERGETLTFFAGGWGRGLCKVRLPSDWHAGWHHIVGVCDGNRLQLYIDGELMDEVPVAGDLEYTEVLWNLGRNAEIPYTRFYEGWLGNVNIFRAALDSSEIKQLYLQSQIK